MKKSVNLWQLWGFASTALGGTLLHFLYDWSGKSLWVAPFSGVNESTWEHMKLLFWPMFVFAIIQSLFFRERKDFWCIKLKGIWLGLVLIPVLFYTYNGVVGKSPDWINISIFFISAAVVYIFESVQFKKLYEKDCCSKFSFVILALTAVLFVVFTFVTPEIGLFLDPLTGGLGI